MNLYLLYLPKNAPISTGALTIGICNNRRQNTSLLTTLPRSQAIYGSSVETFGPYSQHYTKQFMKY